MRSVSQGMCIPFRLRQADMATVNYHPRTEGTLLYVSRAIYQHPAQYCNNEQFKYSGCVTVNEKSNGDHR